MLRFEAGDPRAAQLLRRPALGEQRGDPLVGPVLEQPGEQQVAGLQQGEVLLVLQFGDSPRPWP